MSTNELVNEAKVAGGIVPVMQGQLFCCVPASGEPDKFWVIALNFTSLEELTAALLECRKREWKPFNPTINMKVNGTTLPEPKTVAPGGCPVHGVGSLKTSRKPGMLFCSAKLPDGSYCKHTQPVVTITG